MDDCGSVGPACFVEEADGSRRTGSGTLCQLSE